MPHQRHETFGGTQLMPNWYCGCIFETCQLAGCKFRRQVPIGEDIVDFVCFERKVVIEVDGGHHQKPQYDTDRTTWLESQGFQVVRFWNHEVLTTDVEAIQEELLVALRRDSSLPTHPLPSRGEGEKCEAKMMLEKKKVGMMVSILLVGGALVYLALGNFSENVVYFFTPSEVKVFSPDYYQKKVRVGGMVVEGSMETYPDRLGLTFQLTDGDATIPVTFEGIPPDLFKEGQGAVVEGYWTGKHRFQSNLIMAKHSEDYMPIELKRAGVELPRKDFMKSLVE